jgi:L-amino acid N-acyltransferase YncA
MPGLAGDLGNIARGEGIVDIVVSPMRDEDWDAVQAIYRDGIATGDATFETVVPEWAEWDGSHLAEPRLVARQNGRLVGWAALSRVSGRRVYAGVAEVSVYVAASARGNGIGKALLQALVAESERTGLWTLQASIFRENVASIALHRACGFREVGYRERIGQMNGVWRDTILMERRSRIASIPFRR